VRTVNDWVGQAALPLLQFRSSFVKFSDANPPVLFASENADEPGAISLLRASVGIERIREEIDLWSLPEPMLRHEGIYIAAFHDQLISPVPLPDEWIKLCRKNQVQQALEMEGAPFYEEDEYGYSDSDTLTEPDDAVDSLGQLETEESLWCISITMKDYHHLRSNVADNPHGITQWNTTYEFLGGSYSMSCSTEIRESREAVTVPFGVTQKHVVSCSLRALESLFEMTSMVNVRIGKCLKRRRNLLSVDDANLVSYIYSSKIDVSALCRERYLDDNYPIRDKNGTKIPLLSHQFPPYLSVTVSLNRLHSAVNRFRPSRELTVDEDRDLVVKVLVDETVEARSRKEKMKASASGAIKDIMAVGTLARRKGKPELTRDASKEYDPESDGFESSSIWSPQNSPMSAATNTPTNKPPLDLRHTSVGSGVGPGSGLGPLGARPPATQDKFAHRTTFM